MQDLKQFQQAGALPNNAQESLTSHYLQRMLMMSAVTQYKHEWTGKFQSSSRHTYQYILDLWAWIRINQLTEKQLVMNACFSIASNECCLMFSEHTKAVGLKPWIEFIIEHFPLRNLRLYMVKKLKT